MERCRDASRCAARGGFRAGSVTVCPAVWLPFSLLRFLFPPQVPACLRPGGCAFAGLPTRRGCATPSEHSHDFAHQAAANGRRTLRPSFRARRLRRRHGGAAGQRPHARGDLAGDHRAREPRAPRRDRGGRANGRRRRDLDADARRAAASGGGLRASAAWPLRSADVLPADRRERARAAAEPRRAHRHGRGPDRARVARRARVPGAHR